MALIGDCEFAISQSVPELDRPVARAGNDLTVISGERDGEDIVGMADKATSGCTGGQFPEAESLVPGCGQSVGSI